MANMLIIDGTGINLDKSVFFKFSDSQVIFYQKIPTEQKEINNLEKEFTFNIPKEKLLKILKHALSKDRCLTIVKNGEIVEI